MYWAQHLWIISNLVKFWVKQNTGSFISPCLYSKEFFFFQNLKQKYSKIPWKPIKVVGEGTAVSGCSSSSTSTHTVEAPEESMWILNSHLEKSSDTKILTWITSSSLWLFKLRKWFWERPWLSLAETREVSKPSKEMKWVTYTTYKGYSTSTTKNFTVHSSFCLSAVIKQHNAQDFKHLRYTAICMCAH